SYVPISRTSGDLSPPDEHHAFVWRVADGGELFHESSSSPDVTIAGVALSRDGARIALTSEFIETSSSGRPMVSGGLRVLDVADGRERLHQVSASEGYVYPAISPDGRLVAAGLVSPRDPASAETTRGLVVLEVDSGRARTDAQDLVTGRAIARFSPDSGLLV